MKKRVHRLNERQRVILGLRHKPLERVHIEPKSIEEKQFLKVLKKRWKQKVGGITE